MDADQAKRVADSIVKKLRATPEDSNLVFSPGLTEEIIALEKAIKEAERYAEKARVDYLRDINSPEVLEDIANFMAVAEDTNEKISSAIREFRSDDDDE